MKRPQTVAAEMPDAALVTIDVAAKPVARLAVFKAFFAGQAAASEAVNCLGISWIKILEPGSRIARSDTRTKKAGLKKCT